MPTIKEINEAIETLISECNTHKVCGECPMNENCLRTIYDMGCIYDWEKLDDGERKDGEKDG